MGKSADTKTSAAQSVLPIAANKKARRDYEILSTYEAGISLLGSEVKSMRDGGVNLRDSYVKMRGGEAFLVGCHVSPYSHSRADAYDPVRDRKLLLKRSELDRLSGQVIQKGLTIVPLRLYFKKGRCKLEIGVGRGRKLYDKREAVRRKEAERGIEKALSNRQKGR